MIDGILKRHWHFLNLIDFHSVVFFLGRFWRVSHLSISVYVHGIHPLSTNGCVNWKLLLFLIYHRKRNHFPRRLNGTTSWCRNRQHSIFSRGWKSSVTESSALTVSVVSWVVFLSFQMSTRIVGFKMTQAWVPFFYQRRKKAFDAVFRESMILWHQRVSVTDVRMTQQPQDSCKFRFRYWTWKKQIFLNKIRTPKLC